MKDFALQWLLEVEQFRFQICKQDPEHSELDHAI